MSPSRGLVRAAERVVVIVPEADVEHQLPVQGDLVLREHRRDRRAAPVVEMLDERRVVEVELVLPQVVTVFAADGHAWRPANRRETFASAPHQLPRAKSRFSTRAGAPASSWSKT